jgi:hypothetical protein
MYHMVFHYQLAPMPYYMEFSRAIGMHAGFTDARSRGIVADRKQRTNRGLNRNGTRIPKCLVRFFSDFCYTQNQR